MGRVTGIYVYIDKPGTLRSDMAKSYMKVKINGKWSWKACPTPFAEYQARALCECSRCNVHVVQGDSS